MHYLHYINISTYIINGTINNTWLIRSCNLQERLLPGWAQHHVRSTGTAGDIDHYIAGISSANVELMEQSNPPAEIELLEPSDAPVDIEWVMCGFQHGVGLSNLPHGICKVFKMWNVTGRTPWARAICYAVGGHCRGRDSHKKQMHPWRGWRVQQLVTVYFYLFMVTISQYKHPSLVMIVMAVSQ